MDTLPLRLLRDGDRLRLVSPGVGLFTCALGTGCAVVPEQVAGVLTTLGRSVALTVPEGARGLITSERPELVHAPVGYGTLLYELAPLEAGETAVEFDDDDATDDALVYGAPSSGRFYRRPSPDAPLFVAEGETIEDGAPFGLIEIMKTFHQVHYRAKGKLPSRAKLVRFVAADGADVRENEPLIEVAPV